MALIEGAAGLCALWADDVDVLDTDPDTSPLDVARSAMILYNDEVESTDTYHIIHRQERREGRAFRS